MAKSKPKTKRELDDEEKTQLKKRARNRDDDVDVADDEGEPQVKKRAKASEDDEPQMKKRPAREPVDDDADDDEPQMKKRPAKQPVDDDDEEPQVKKKSTKKTVDDDEPQVKKKSSKQPVDDEDEEELQVKSSDDDDIAVANADDIDLDALDDDKDAEPAGAFDDLDIDAADADVEADAQVKDLATEVEDDDDGDDDDKPVPAKPTGPRPKVTKTVIALIILNWIAAPAFLTMALLDNMARMQYAHRTNINYIQFLGLPLSEEEDFPSLSNETRPLIRLNADQLREAVQNRTRKSYKDIQPFDEKFVLEYRKKGNLDEPIAVGEIKVPFRLRPSDMTASMQRDVFEYQGLTDPVATLDDEMLRLQTDLPNAIEKAAKDVADVLKTDADKKTAIRKALFPIAWNVWQVEKLEDTIGKTKGAELDTLLVESLQRRMYYDILAPLNVYRPGDLADPKNYKVERISDQAYTLEQIKGFMKERLEDAVSDKQNFALNTGDDYYKDAPADARIKKSVEKRQTVGFIMFAIGQTRVPLAMEKEKDKDGKDVLVAKALYPKGIQRAQVVCGLNEFTNSSIRYVQALHVLDERIKDAIVADREGYRHIMKNDPTKMARTMGFAASFELEIDRLVKIKEAVDVGKKRLTDLLDQKAQVQKTYAQRVQQHKETFEALLIARGNTEKYAKDLRALQDQLHEALVQLSDAAEQNFRLLDEITRIEKGLQKKAGRKGGKKQP
ncbi:MAG: hypothetical protein HYX68_20690 [Planctomycetes bacterium]|nr:hypothetical protein [Planctomycetota bacterium]